MATELFSKSRLLSNLSQRLRGGESLRSRMFAGGMWLGTGMSAEQVLRFARNMLLARLLAPAAFGTMAVVLSVVSVIHTLIELGVREALIQNPRGKEPAYIGAAWWMSFGRALGFWILIATIAPFAARFYNSAELGSMLRFAGLSIVFDGAISARTYAAIKELRFGRWAVINHGGGIVGVLITIGLSFYLHSVWALVLGYVAESASRFVLSYVLFPFLPPVCWDRHAMRDLFGFSRRMFGLSLFNLIFARADIFVLAKLHSPSELGLYSLAVYLVQTPTSFLMNMLGQTVLPALSAIQEDKARMNQILLRISSAIFLAGMPILVFLIFCGKSLLTIVYGKPYAAAAGPLFVASIVALLNLVNGQITSIIFARGVPDLHRRCVIAMAVVMVTLVYPFTREFGLVGAQCACLMAMIVGFVYQIISIRSLTAFDVRPCARTLSVALLAAAFVAVVCSITRIVSAANEPVPNVIFGIAGCGIAYGALCLIILKYKQNSWLKGLQA